MSAKLVFFNSKDPYSAASAACAYIKYGADADMNDTQGKTIANLTTLLNTFTDNTATVIHQSRILCYVGVARVEEIRATAKITVTNGGTAGDVIAVTIDEGTPVVTIGSFTSAAGTVTDIAVGLKASINFGTTYHGYTADNAAGVLTISAPVGTGVSANAYVAAVQVAGTSLAASVTNQFNTTTNGNVKGVTAAGNEGDFSAAQLAGKLTDLLDDYTGTLPCDLAPTSFAPVFGTTQNLCGLAWEDLYPTVTKPEVINRMAMMSKTALILKHAQDYGWATAGSDATHLEDSTRGAIWVANKWTGCYVYIMEGTGAGQISQIVSNTTTKLLVASWGTATPDITSKYGICQNYEDCLKEMYMMAYVMVYLGMGSSRIVPFENAYMSAILTYVHKTESATRTWLRILDKGQYDGGNKFGSNSINITNNTSTYQDHDFINNEMYLVGRAIYEAFFVQ